MLLGDNTGRGDIRFKCAGVWLSLGLVLMYILTIDHVYSYAQFRLVPDFRERNYCVCRRVSVYQLLK
jgi:hypothetical protein